MGGFVESALVVQNVCTTALFMSAIASWMLPACKARFIRAWQAAAGRGQRRRRGAVMEPMMPPRTAEVRPSKPVRIMQRRRPPPPKAFAPSKTPLRNILPTPSPPQDVAPAAPPSPPRDIALAPSSSPSPPKDVAPPPPPSQLPPQDVAPQEDAPASSPAPLPQESFGSCCICLDTARDVMLPCRHICTCVACTKSLLRTATPRCPMCRKEFHRFTKVYFC